MSEAVRQRYGMATGKGLQSAPPSKPSPGYRDGGKVKAGGSPPAVGRKKSKSCP